MKHRVVHATEASPDRVRALLADPGSWAGWLRGVTVEGEPGTLPATLQISLAAPRPLRATLYVEPVEDGIRYTLVEGELATLTGRIAARGEGSGAVVDWEQEIEPAVTLGGAFAAEIERVLQRWAAALARQAS